MADKKDSGWGCFFGHSWTRWETIKKGNLVRRGTQSVIGHAVIQQRECQICGKIELNSQEVYH